MEMLTSFLNKRTRYPVQKRRNILSLVERVHRLSYLSRHKDTTARKERWSAALCWYDIDNPCRIIHRLDTPAFPGIDEIRSRWHRYNDRQGTKHLPARRNQTI